MSEPTEPDEPQEAPTDEPGLSDDEQAEAEAHEAENAAREPVGQTGDGDGDGDGEPENVGTQAQAQAQRDEQKAIDKMFKDFEKETARHTKRVAEIAGDSAPDLLQCPMCAPDEGQPAITGWLLPVPPSDEKIANVRTAIGLAPKIDYREDPHSRVCPTCGGLTVVLPAGATPNIQPLPCVDCKAQGWQPTDERRGGVTTNGEVSQPITVQQSAPPSLEPDPPEVAALKAKGFTVIAPYTAGT